MATLDNIKNYDPSSDGMGLPINILRGNPIPLDNSSLFLSKRDAEVYAATSSIAYIGQIIVAIEDDVPKAYIIKDKDGTLEEIGSGNKLPSGIDANSYLNVQKIGRVATLTATDSLGTTTVTVTDGKNGVDGFSPYINEDGFWVTQDGVSNLPVTGPKGDRGEAFQLKHVYATIADRDKDKSVEVGDMVVVEDEGRLFVKTETDWLEIGDFQSIPGEKGEKGDTGPKGDKGDEGDEGYSPTISAGRRLDDGTVAYTVTYKDNDDGQIKTRDLIINEGYFPEITIKDSAKEDTPSVITINYRDNNGSVRTETLDVYNGHSPHIEDKVDRVIFYTNYRAEVVKPGDHSHEIVNGVLGTVHEIGGNYYTTWPATWDEKFEILKNDTLSIDKSSDGTYTILTTNKGLVDIDGNSREEQSYVYNGDTITVEENSTIDGVDITVNKGRVDADGNSMESPTISLKNGFSPELTIQQLQGGLHRFTATKKDGTSQSVDINTGYTPTITYNKTDERGIYDLTIDNNGNIQHVEVNEGYAPTVTIKNKEPLRYDLVIDDKNGTTTTTLSSATISAGDKVNGCRPITINDGINGERVFNLYDGEFAYDDSDLQERVKGLETDFADFVGFDTKIISESDFSKQGEKGIVYLVPDELGGYSEYIWVDNSYISLGTSASTLNQFVKKTDIAAVGTLGIVKPDDSTIKVDADGVISIKDLPEASTTEVGGIKYDNKSLELNSNKQLSVKLKSDATNGLSYDANGLYTEKINIATNSKVGIMRPDNTDLKVDGNGIISINNVPAASTTKVGGIKYDNQSLALNSSSQLAVKLSSDSTNGLSYDSKGLYSQKINIATTKETGIVKPDGTTVTVDADGTIHTKVKGGASKTPGNTLSEKDDGLYVGTGSDKELGSVKVDGSSISATSGEISVKIDATDSDNALISGTNGLSIAKASDTKYGMVKIDNKTIGLDKNGVTQVKLSAITETYRQENIDFGESYDYTNNLRVNAPYKITITPKSGTGVSPSVNVYHESMITGVRKLVKTFTSGTYSDILPKETTIIVTNNADASSTLSILNNPDENLITVEKDGLMVDRYKNLATTYTPGFVIPDNDTVTVDGNGVISSTIGANSVSYRTRNLIQLIRTYESLSVLPTVGKANLIYKIPVNSSDPETLYKEYIWDGSKYVDTGVIGEGNEDGIYIDEDDTVPIATYVDEGKVRPDGNTIILENPDDVNNGTILVNTEVIATQNDIVDVNNSIDAVDMASPTLVPYDEDELYELAWNLVTFDEKPEYTKEELDAILDQISFGGSGSGGSGSGGASGGELSAADVTKLWNEALGIGGTS